MKAKSMKGKTVEEINKLVESSIVPGFDPTIAVIFIAGKNRVQAISEIFEKRGISLFGASSFGHFIDKDFDTNSIVVMLLEIPKKEFRIEFRSTGEQSTREIAESIARAGQEAFTKPAFIVASGGIKTDGEEIVNGILHSAGNGTTIFGGLAASDFNTMETFVFTNGQFTDNGLVALVLNEEKISVKGFATGGSQPVGMFHTITSSKGNEVFTIDNQPALEMVLRYSGKDIEALKKESDLLGIARMFQIQLQRENASPVVRTPMLANFQNKSVVFTGKVPPGSKVKFCILPDFEVVENVIRDFSQYRKNVATAEAMILFSCQGRQFAFGPWMEDEIDRLNRLWNVPMIGLFSFGEIGRNPEGRTEFYNLTCSVALLNEMN